ncbi:conserved protein, unknown function [Hepatocystis sp. ex Piliocolobus tephrosceles]|nr:conserved protein, unknown function [Hepatocystis sp. ex Piliocolobus tephrosceles]
MNHKALLSYIFFVSFLLLKYSNVECQPVLPPPYTTHTLYSFNKANSHDIKNDLRNIVTNFIASKVKLLKNKWEEYRSDDLEDDIIDKLVTNDYDSSLEDEINSLLKEAENKRSLSKKIKLSYDRALKSLEQKKKKRRSGGASVNSSTYYNSNNDDDKARHVLEHNLEQIDYLIKKSEYLEKKALELKNHLNSGIDKDDGKNNNCTISKTGILKFVTSVNGLTHSVDKVQAEINNNGFFIFYKNKKKMAYLWNMIDLPIKLIGNVEQCFFFVYKNSNQIFCTDNKLKTASWVNSLSEASICSNFGTKGILIDTNSVKDKLNKKNKKKTNDDNLLKIELKPEETITRVFVNDKEHKLENNGNVISLNKIKNQMENEKKKSKAEEQKENVKENNQTDNNNEKIKKDAGAEETAEKIDEEIEEEE